MLVLLFGNNDELRIRLSDLREGFKRFPGGRSTED